jgi:transposase-like protein
MQKDTVVLQISVGIEKRGVIVKIGCDATEFNTKGTPLMGSVRRGTKAVKGRELLMSAIGAAHGELLRVVGQEISGLLMVTITQLLQRVVHERRRHLGVWMEGAGRCQRCKSQTVRDFTRNGYRPRSLLTPLGWIEFGLPRVRCRCGGSVTFDLTGLVRPYQRISDVVDEQIQRWYRVGMSLRQLHRELDQSYIGPLALRTLLLRVQQSASPIQLRGVPPIVQVDAIWVTQVLPTGRSVTDRKGRKRAGKGRFKQPIFVALGIWPATNHAQVLDWMVGQNEEAQAWAQFLTRLEAAGIRAQHGLHLIIHDGGSGLCAALSMVHFGVATQRCLFHKLRNIANAIHLPQGLTRTERSARRKAVLKRFQAIWQAKRYTTALRRYLQVVRDFRLTQPDAVASLRRDFRATLTFYSLADTYPPHHLRTTSRLERFNRTLRTRLRAANVLHSVNGLTAMISQQIHTFNANFISTN